MRADGVPDIKVHTKMYIRRRLETELGSCIKITHGNKNRLLVIPDSVTFEELARENMTLRENLCLYSSHDQSMEHAISKSTVLLRNVIKAEQHEQPWSLHPDELDEQYVCTPELLQLFFLPPFWLDRKLMRRFHLGHNSSFGRFLKLLFMELQWDSSRHQSTFCPNRL